ncbi:MAG: hypothetical protein GWN71_33500, partial [Gammaproteobacteria bacterium]|nr:hypothetical protein [Gemmatimonadota bacterium]NIU78296.1 hypothetical protein [Gammaproteobacteria bacterium]
MPFNARGDTSRKLYLPHAQFAGDRNWAMIQTVSARTDARRLQDDIRDVIAGLDG